MAPSSRPRHAVNADDAAASQPLLSGSRDSTAADYAGTATSDTSRPQTTAIGASSRTFNPTLGALDAFAIVISIVIGSGIFTSPGAIDTNSPSPGAALLIWLVGGVLAWTGAATMAELGTAIPSEGGVQPYLKYCFGDVFGFLAAWTWIVAVMPATLAILSIVFVESIYTARGITDGAAEWTHKLLSVGVVVLVSVANCISTKASTRLNKFFVATKFLAIAAVVLAGLVVVILQLVGKAPSGGDSSNRDWVERNWFATRPVVNPDGSVNDWQGLGTWEMMGFYSTALYGALWAYSGWDKAVYISAELSQPAKQLPLAINTAIPTIIACFLAANAAYYVLLPWDVVSTTDSVAVTAITRLLGHGFGIVAAIIVCLVVVGSLLGNSFVAGRMAVAAANTGWFPSVFSVVGRLGHPYVKPANAPSSSSISSFRDPAAVAESDGSHHQVEEGEASDAPINAIVLSALLSALYIVLGSFRALVTFNGLGEYTFFFLAVLGALVLRWREPELDRPYKPLVAVPGVFVVVSGFVVVRGAIFAPAQAVVLLGLWAVGLVVYWARRKWFSSV